MATERRLIDANALIEKARWMEEPDGDGIPCDIKAVSVIAIEDAPTVDAIPLPCKLGDPVYIIAYLRNGNPSHIIERRCTGIHITEKVFGHRAEKSHHYLVVNSDIGFAEHIPFAKFYETVFFSRKEAEAALAERKMKDSC